MADNRLSENHKSLNPADKNLTDEARCERLFLLFAQLEALLKVAERSDLTQLSEATFYHYFDVMQEQLANLKSSCEWLARKVLPNAQQRTSSA